MILQIWKSTVLKYVVLDKFMILQLYLYLSLFLLNKLSLTHSWSSETLMMLCNHVWNEKMSTPNQNKDSECKYVMGLKRE
jgi:hypothetical protein